jgi:hypothetical protein
MGKPWQILESNRQHPADRAAILPMQYDRAFPAALLHGSQQCSWDVQSLNPLDLEKQAGSVVADDVGAVAIPRPTAELLAAPGHPAEQVAEDVACLQFAVLSLGAR